MSIILAGSSHAQFLLDDFNRANNTAVGNGWTEGGASSSGAITGNMLWVNNTAGLNGQDWVSRSATGLYNTTFGTSTCGLTWGVNMQLDRDAPSGFDNGNYGAAFILGGTTLDPTAATNSGYAVVIGNSGSPDPVRLVRFATGLTNPGITTLISAPITDKQYVSVRVTFNPFNNEWELFVQAGATFVPPMTVVVSAGTAMDVTHTLTDLPYVSLLYNHNTSTTDLARFDNVFVPNPCPVIPPTVNFSSGDITDLESSGSHTFTISIAPVANTPQTITVSLADLGTTPGVDYTTTPAAVAGIVTLNVPANAMSVSVVVNILNDAIVEPDETLSMTISATGPGLTIGTASTRLLNIIDDDAPQTVLGPGDLAIVAINVNNGLCSTFTGEDEISFFCFKDITPGTTLDITDNGYSRCTPGLWGDTEGTVRLTRTGPTIPAGTVITWRARNTSGANNVVAIGPDVFWKCASLNGGTSTFNLNASGDQIFFMQGGVWTNPAGANDATYTGGSILYGFSTNGQWLAGQCASSQNSGLPIQMDCFSMAPVAVSDFNKYTGPTTPATQRQWIIRIDDPANWTSTYGNCTNYNSSLPDYTLAPVLPVIPGGFTPGLWTGAKSTSWFDCTNWDDATVPSTTTDVLINQTAIRHCDVDNSVAPGFPTTTANCASVTVTSTSTARQLTIKNGNSLVVGGAALVNNVASATPIGITVLNGTLAANSLTLQGFTTGSALFVHEAPGNTVQIYGPVTIASGGTLDLAGAALGGTLSVAGNFANLDGVNGFLYTFSTVNMMGGGAQSVLTAGGLDQSFHNLRMDKPSGDLTLLAPITIHNNLNLLNGRIMNTATTLLTIPAGATATNASDLSFVHGPVQKVGTTNFTYPVGKANFHRPAALTGITGLPTDAFIVEYHLDNPKVTHGTARELSLHHISGNEWWNIARSAGAADANVVLSWGSTSGGVTLLSDLRVARWDGLMWRDRGNGGTTGNLLQGTVVTAAQQTQFSPWTLASNTIENPLPVELLWFTATPDGHQVRLNWSTATEHNNAFFTVERSLDGDLFTAFAEVAGAGNSQAQLHYQTFDPQPKTGTNYYRLRQTDHDGISAVSPMVAVQFNGPQGGYVVLRPDDGTLVVLHAHDMEAQWDLIDAMGRMIPAHITKQEGRTVLHLLHIPSGTYLIRVLANGRMGTVRFVH
ncbi:MAG: hypothetical protein JNM31_01195 [Flavobacteriales bacterium]|nr:hypothetical protein [Flavobacteriales bacterium]